MYAYMIYEFEFINFWIKVYSQFSLPFVASLSFTLSLSMSTVIILCFLYILYIIFYFICFLYIFVYFIYFSMFICNISCSYSIGSQQRLLASFPSNLCPSYISHVHALSPCNTEPLYKSLMLLHCKIVPLKVPIFISFSLLSRCINNLSSPLWADSLLFHVQCHHETRYLRCRNHVRSLPTPYIPQLWYTAWKKSKWSNNSCYFHVSNLPIPVIMV